MADGTTMAGAYVVMRDYIAKQEIKNRWDRLGLLSIPESEHSLPLKGPHLLKAHTTLELIF